MVHPQTLSPEDALQRLIDGNRRFSHGKRSADSKPSSLRREELANEGQKPFSVILSCSDSRAPSEMIFDCGLGHLFVVRVAGNIIAPSLVGSIEFAVLQFDTPLVVVMGHTQCGAIAAAVDYVQTNKRAPTDNLQNLVREILPSAKSAVSASSSSTDHMSIVNHAAALNTEQSLEALVDRSQVLSSLARTGQIKLVSAMYDITSGMVSFREYSPAAVSS